MTTLSAKSRRSSAISSASSSPRPSLSGCLISPIIDKNTSQSKGESVDVISVNKPIKENSCTERSDSGFSERSNCSSITRTNCGCTNLMDQKLYVVPNLDKLKYEISSDILVSKLQNIAELQECVLSNSSDSIAEKYTYQRKPIKDIQGLNHYS